MLRPTGNGPGHGGPAKGPGRGGPAKGPGSDKPKTDVKAGHPPIGAQLENGDPVEQSFRAERRRLKRERRDLAERALLRDAVNAEEARDRITAADKLLAHLGPEGGVSVSGSGISVVIRGEDADL